MYSNVAIADNIVLSTFNGLREYILDVPNIKRRKKEMVKV